MKPDRTDLEDQLEITGKASQSLFNKSAEDPFADKKAPKGKVWDRVAKKFVTRSEESSKTLFNPTEKSQSYKQWLKKANAAKTKQLFREHNKSNQEAPVKNEIKSIDQIIKNRNKNNAFHKATGANSGAAKAGAAKKGPKKGAKKPTGKQAKKGKGVKKAAKGKKK